MKSQSIGANRSKAWIISDCINGTIVSIECGIQYWKSCRIRVGIVVGGVDLLIAWMLYIVESARTDLL